jgi:hypothetical protein
MAAGGFVGSVTWTIQTRSFEPMKGYMDVFRDSLGNDHTGSLLQPGGGVAKEKE